MDQKRVFLQEGGWTWRYRNEHCSSQPKSHRHSLLCYFEPLSKCTLKDALLVIARSGRNSSISPDDRNTSNDQILELLDEEGAGINWTNNRDRLLESAVLKIGQRGPWAKIAAVVFPGQSSSRRSQDEIECYRRYEFESNLAGQIISR